jgi:hypothetical protein
MGKAIEYPNLRETVKTDWQYRLTVLHSTGSEEYFQFFAQKAP